VWTMALGNVHEKEQSAEKRKKRRLTGEIVYQQRPNMEYWETVGWTAGKQRG